MYTKNELDGNSGAYMYIKNGIMECVYVLLLTKRNSDTDILEKIEKKKHEYIII